MKRVQMTLKEAVAVMALLAVGYLASSYFKALWSGPEKQKGPVVRCEFADRASGVPLDHVTAELNGSEEIETTGGSLTLDRVFDSRDSLTVRAAGHSGLLLKPAGLSPGGHRLYLFPRDLLHLRLVDKGSGMPLAWRKVSLTQGNFVSEAETDAEGALRPDVLVSRSPQGGRYSLDLVAEVEGYLPATVRADLSDAAPITRDLALVASRRLDLVALDSRTGRPLPDVQIAYAWRAKDRSSSHVSPRAFLSDAVGELSIAIGPGSGSLELIAHHPDYAIKGMTVQDVEAIAAATGGDRRVAVLLEEGFEVEGLVVDDEGNPIARVNIDLDRLDAPDFSQWMRSNSLRFFGKVPDLGYTDSDGAFRVSLVPRGKYQVSLSHRDFHPDPTNDPLAVEVGDQPAWAGRMRKGARLAGIVVAEDGSPVPGALGLLTLKDGNGRAIKGFGKTFRSDGQGAFQVQGLVAGAYLATFSTKSGKAFSGTVDPSAPPSDPWRVVLAASLKPTREQGSE